MAKDRFEDALHGLEELVHKMESGELSLEESLKAFEEGIRLSRLCAKKLDEAERRVEVLLRDGEDLVERPLTGTDPEA
jgi:exodeoxyribonuclease VII small subunit